MSADREEWDYGPFKVGDVVQVYNCHIKPEFNGSMVTITSPLKSRLCSNLEMVYSYGCELPNGRKGALLPSQVRRRKPPITGLKKVLAMFDKRPERVKELT